MRTYLMASRRAAQRTDLVRSAVTPPPARANAS